MNPLNLGILIEVIDKADAEGDHDRAHGATDAMLALFIEALADGEVEDTQGCARVLHTHLSAVDSEKRPRYCS